MENKQDKDRNPDGGSRRRRNRGRRNNEESRPYNRPRQFGWGGHGGYGYPNQPNPFMFSQNQPWGMPMPAPAMYPGGIYAPNAPVAPGMDMLGPAFQASLQAAMLQQLMSGNSLHQLNNVLGQGPASAPAASAPAALSNDPSKCLFAAAGPVQTPTDPWKQSQALIVSQSAAAPPAAVSAASLLHTIPVPASVSKVSSTVTSPTSPAIAILPCQAPAASETFRQTRSSVLKVDAPSALPRAPPKITVAEEDAVSIDSDKDDYTSIFDDIDQESSNDCEMIEGNSNHRGLYLPGKSQPDDVGAESGGESSTRGSKPSKQQRTSVKTGAKSGGNKKGAIHKSTHEKLKKEAEKWNDASVSSKPSSRNSKPSASQSMQTSRPMKKVLTRMTKKQELGSDDMGFVILDALQEKVKKTVMEAYARARTSDEDLAEIKALKKAGVLLPNGLVPFPPMFSEDGEKMLEMYSDSD